VLQEHQGTLSQHEIDALLSQVTQGSAPASEPQGARRGEASRYDFRSPARFSREQMRTLRLVYEDFARQCSSSLSVLLRSEVEVRLTHLEQSSGQSLSSMVGDASSAIVNLIHMAPLPGRALLIVEADLVAILVDRVLGGLGRPYIRRKREITDIERSLMEEVIRHMNRGLRTAWSKVTEVEPELESSSLDLEIIQSALGDEIVFAVLLEVLVNEVSGTMAFVLPLTLLQPIVGALRPHLLVMQHPEQEVEEDGRSAALTLEQAPVPVTVLLGTADLTFGELLDLSPGDVLCLNVSVNDDLPVTVNDVTKFRCRPGTRGKQLAVYITDTVM
jgi:flagellar motor switch protein FliM